MKDREFIDVADDGGVTLVPYPDSSEQTEEINVNVADIVETLGLDETKEEDLIKLSKMIRKAFDEFMK